MIADYGDMTVEDKLDIMESFICVLSMPVKSGEMVFLCNCSDAYSNYACEHGGVLSMLWNEEGSEKILRNFRQFLTGTTLSDTQKILRNFRQFQKGCVLDFGT